MRRRYVWLWSAFIFFFLLVPCRSLVVSTEAAADPAAKVKSDRSPGWEEDWKKTLDAARKEGKLHIYSVASGAVRGALSKAFVAKYGIQLEFITGRGPEFTAKISAERRANLYLADMHIGGSTTSTMEYKPKGFLAPLKPLIVLPEVSEAKIWYGGGLHFSDKERQYIACPILTASNNYLSVNTDLVKPGEIKSYKDLLNPKWKGRIIMNDPTVGGAGSRWFAVVADQFMGLDYMRSLASQEPVITREQRLQVESLARGKYAIAIGMQPDIQAEFVKYGSPIKTVVPEEGGWLGGGPGLIGYFDRAPHPNAAKIFANWFLSKEGQTLYSKTALAESARLDVPNDHIAREDRRIPGVKYFIGDDEDFLIKKTEYEHKWAKEIFGFLVK